MARPLGITAHPPLAGNPFGAVAFVFDQAMVDPRRPPVPPAHKLRVTPPADGRLQWLGDRTLVFVPRRRLRYATAYTVRLSPPLQARSGARLTREAETGFTTVAPALLDSTPAENAREVDTQPTLRLRFNQPMSSAAVVRAARLVGPGEPRLALAVRPHRSPANEVWLRVKKPLRESTGYQLRLPAGLRGAEGPIGSLAATAVPFTTAGPLRLRTARCRPGPCKPGDTLVLETAGSPGPVCGLLRVTPVVEDLRCQIRRGRVELRGSFEAETRYGLQLVGDGPLDSPLDPITVDFGRRVSAVAFSPNRPLLQLPATAKRLPVSGTEPTRLRVAEVSPEMASTVLTAIADPGALPPFQLARRAPRSLPEHPDGGFDLGALGPEPGLWLASLDPRRPAPTLPGGHRRTALVVRSDLSVVARYGWDAGVVLVAQVKDGRPVVGASLRVRDRSGRTLWQGRTDGDGLAHFPGRRRLRRSGPFTLWARQGAHQSFLVLDGGGEDEIRTPGYLRGQRLPAVERMIGGVFSDRPQYRPGDSVRLFGVLRGQTRLPRGSIGHLSSSHQRVAYRVVSETEEEVATGQTRLDAAGLFRTDFRLPRGAEPGQYTVWLHLPGARRAYANWVLGGFSVVSRRRRLQLWLSAHQRARLGRHTTIGLRLAEPSGRAAPGATVRWRLYRHRGAPPPAGQPDFRFGRATGPTADELPDFDRADGPEGGVWVAGGTATTDAQGRLALRPRLAAQPSTRAATYELVAEATTLDGRSTRRTLRIVARRSARHLGLRPATQLQPAGQPLTVWLLGADARGAPRAASTVQVTAHPFDGPRAGPAQSRCTADLALATDSCRLVLATAGRYLLRVASTDPAAPDAPAPAETVVHAYAKPGSTAATKPHRAAPAVEIVPDRRWYREADRAQLLIRSPVSPATALLTLERDGIVSAERVHLSAPDTLVSVDLGQGLVPNVWVGVTVLGAHNSHGVPAAALSERVRLTVLPAAGPLQVRVTSTRTRPPPGASLPVSVRITDGKGQGVRSAALLLLQPSSAAPPPDLASCLQRDRGPGIALRTSAAHRLSERAPTEDPPVLEEPPSVPAPDGPPTPVPRSNGGLFFRGPVQTDDHGRIDVSVPLPNRPGRYRLVVLAADRSLWHRVGRGVQAVRVEPALALEVRPPEMLRQGDRVAVSARVRNHTDQPLSITVMARADRLPITSRVRYLRLPPKAAGRVAFSARATRVGLVRLQVAAVAGAHRVARERRLTVRPSARDRTVRRTGVLRRSAALQLRGQAPSTRARHSLILSNSPLGAALSSLRWLLLRRALTLEAATTRLLALRVAHRHRDSALAALLPDATARRALCRRAVRQLLDLELPRGGLRRYDGGPPANANELALALLAMGRTRGTGCAVPSPLIASLVLRLRALAADPDTPATQRAAALAALHRHRGAADHRKVGALLALGRRLDWSARGQLVDLLTDRRRRGRLQAALDLALQTEELPRWVKAELAARSLLSAVSGQASAQAVRARVTTLLALGHDGRWGNARATAWALHALSRAEPRLARTRGTATARAWLDRRHWGGRALRPGTLDVIRLRAGGLTKDPRLLRMATSGTTPVYFALTRTVRSPLRLVSGAPASLSVRLSPAGPGVVVDESRPLPLQIGHGAVGRVTVVVTEPLGATVLRVPIPAGSDVVDPGHPRLVQASAHRFPPPPVLDATVRDGVLRLHLAALPPGIYEHRLTLQATAAGRFGCAPATLHRSGDDRLLARDARCRPVRIRREGRSVGRVAAP